MKKYADLRKMSHEEWLVLRKNGIGGSDVGAVCGMNPYKTAIQVYYDKISDTVELIDNEAMKQGRAFEDYVASRFMEATGKKVRKSNFMYIHENYPFMLADIDRWVVGENAGLECKTANTFMADQWRDGVPVSYLLQCYHYIATCNADAWYIAVLIYGREFKYYKIERDEQILESLVEIERDFWINNIGKGIIPEPDGSKTADKVLSECFKDAGNKNILLTGFNEQLERRQELQELIDKLDKEKNTIDQKIKLFLGEQDAEIAENDRFRVSWKNINSNRLDEKKLKEEQPDVYDKYVRVVQSRRFTVKAA